MTFWDWLGSLASWSAWAPALPTAILLGLASAIVAPIYRASIEKSIAHRFELKIEELRSKLRNEEEERKASIKRSDAQLEDLRKSALSGISARHALIDKRRIEAIEKLWSHISDRSPLKSVANFTKSIKIDALLKGASKGDSESIKLRQFAEIIRRSSGLVDISIIPPQNALLKERIFLPQTLWSKYIAYDQALNAPFGYLSAVENGIDSSMFEFEPILKLFKEALPNFAEFIDQHGINSISHLIEPLESLLLEEAISSLGASPSDSIIVSQAVVVIEEANRAAAERTLAGIEIPHQIRA